MDPADIRYVLLTHSHYDHTGNARAMRERGAKLVAHPIAAEALATGDERTIHYAFLRADFPTTQVDILVHDGDVIRAGSWEFTALNIPGHTDGNMLYLTEREGKRIMFAGDFVFHARPATVEGTLAWNGGPDFNTDKFIQSLLRIQQIRADVFLTGHFGFLMEHGSAIVDHGLVVALRAWGNKYAEKQQTLA
jgi:glyoxylase-like metal-dependent hydrolase (beta-lactamase superfamily II)